MMPKSYPEGKILLHGHVWLIAIYFCQTSEGERLARVSYSTIHSVNIGTKTAKERQQKKGNVSEDLWDMLRRHLRWMQLEKTQRFSQEMVKRAYRQLVLEEEKVLYMSLVTRKPVFRIFDQVRLKLPCSVSEAC